MRRTREKTAQAAAAAIHRAKNELTTARRRLARATRPDAQPIYVSPPYRWAFRALDEYRRKIARAPGVVGLGVGRQLRAGLPTGDLCITVFVAEKLPPNVLRERNIRPLPKYVTFDKRRLKVDVVEIGEIRRHVVAGTSMGPHSIQNEGTLGTFARERDTGTLVAITAMHVSGFSEYPNGEPPPTFSTPSTRRGLPTQTLGAMTFGTMTGIDAAKIVVATPDDALNVIPGIGMVAGWRPVTFPGDENTSIRMVGAVSGFVSGTIVHPAVALSEIGLDTAIIANIPSLEGDSGAAILDGQNHILGFLVGEATSGPYANLRIFSPAQNVLNVLNCDIE
jgi:hypothetical protein